MNQILITGPYPLILAAAALLSHSGHADTTHQDLNNPKKLIFIHADLDKLEFTQTTSNVSSICDTDVNYFFLPLDWDDLVLNIDESNQKRIDLLLKAEAEQALHLNSTEHTINPFDPTGSVKDIDAATLDFLLACPKCGGYHSRHAGYFTTKSAYKNVDERAGSTFTTNVPVHICVNCKTPIASLGGVMYDVSKYVDLKAWVKTEKEAHAATGPGGQC